MADEDRRSHAAGREAESLLAHAVAQRPSPSQLVVCLFDLEGPDVEVIARRLNRSPGAVYMLRARAQDKLRKPMGVNCNFFSDGA
jgi:DNA-directed RNA polymerase specialized sigma24 family protein